MAGGSMDYFGGYYQFQDNKWFENIAKSLEHELEKPAQPDGLVMLDYPNRISNTNILAEEDFKRMSESVQMLISTLIAKTVIDKATESFHEKLKYQNITTSLLNILKNRLQYQKNGFVILNDSGEVEKEINSPGQLGLVIFQFLNDAIEAEKGDEKIETKSGNDNFFDSLFS